MKRLIAGILTMSMLVTGTCLTNVFAEENTVDIENPYEEAADQYFEVPLESEIFELLDDVEQPMADEIDFEILSDKNNENPKDDGKKIIDTANPAVHLYVSGNEIEKYSKLEPGTKVQIVVLADNVCDIEARRYYDLSLTIQTTEYWEEELIGNAKYIKAGSPDSDYLPYTFLEDERPTTDCYITEFTMPDKDTTIMAYFEECDEATKKEGNVHCGSIDGFRYFTLYDYGYIKTSVNFLKRNHYNAQNGKADLYIRASAKDTLNHDIADVIVHDLRGNIIPVKVDYVKGSGYDYHITFDMPEDGRMVAIAGVEWTDLLDNSEEYKRERKIARLYVDNFSEELETILSESKHKNDDGKYEEWELQSMLGLDDTDFVKSYYKKGKFVRNELGIDIEHLFGQPLVMEENHTFTLNAGVKANVGSYEVFTKPCKKPTKKVTDDEDYDDKYESALSAYEEFKAAIDGLDKCKAELISCDNPDVIKLKEQVGRRRYMAMGDNSSTPYYTYYKKYSIETKAIKDKPVSKAVIKCSDDAGKVVYINLIVRNIEFDKNIKKEKIHSTQDQPQQYKVSLTEVGTGNESDVYSVAWDIKGAYEDAIISPDSRSVLITPRKGKVKINAYVLGKKYSTYIRGI